MSYYGTRVHRIEYACGHVDDVPLTGSSAEQIAEVLRLESRSCLECFRQNRERQSKAFTQRIESERPGLGPLIGTPRQIEWASFLRAEAITLIEEVIGEEVDLLAQAARDDRSKSDEYQGTAARLLAAATETGNTPDARFWIENRGVFRTAETMRAYLISRARGRRLMY